MTPRLNSLLADLPEAEFRLLSQHLELVSLQKGQTLFDIGDIPAFVYFPIGAIVSMLNDMSDGVAIEIYMLGKTCMVGVGTVGQPSFYRACVRSPGLAYKMSAQALLKERMHCPSYVHHATVATNRMLMQLSQAIACSKRHPIKQQLIRWILITLDRTLSKNIQITHQELAEILGFRREAITLTLGKLTDLKSIRMGRGELEVLDRQVLENHVCECYWIGQERKRLNFLELSTQT
jgi:CRP-like cAMP-binding protein